MWNQTHDDYWTLEPIGDISIKIYYDMFIIDRMIMSGDECIEMEYVMGENIGEDERLKTMEDARLYIDNLISYALRMILDI